jgi:hypothetical protein
MTEAAANKVKAPNYGVMKKEILEEACTHYGLKPARTIMATAAVLRKFFAEKAASNPELLSECSSCNGASLSDYPKCPYCGDAELVDVPPSDPETGEATPSEEPAADAEPATEIETSAEVVEETTKPAEPPKLALVKGTGESVTKKSKAAKAEEAAVAKVGKAAKGKKGKAEVAAGPGERAELAIAENARESVLDRILAEARQFKQDTSTALWNLGNRLRVIKDENLWHERKDDKGAPKYRVFAAFVKEELGLEKETAYSLMEVAQTFQLEQVESYGMEKCRVIVGLPEALREQKQREIAAGASVRELRDSVRNKRDGNDAEPGDVMGAISIMVRVSEEPQTLPLFKTTARPAKKGPKPAETLADKPWAEEKHENGTVTRYMIVDDGNELKLVIHRRRGE